MTRIEKIKFILVWALILFYCVCVWMGVFVVGKLVMNYVSQ